MLFVQTKKVSKIPNSILHFFNLELRPSISETRPNSRGLEMLGMLPMHPRTHTESPAVTLFLCQQDRLLAPTTAHASAAHSARGGGLPVTPGYFRQFIKKFQCAVLCQLFICPSPCSPYPRCGTEPEPSLRLALSSSSQLLKV